MSDDLHSFGIDIPADMPLAAKIVSGLIAVASSAGAVVASQAVVPHAGSTIALLLGVVLGGLSSIIVVSLAVLFCRMAKRIRQRATARGERAARRDAADATGEQRPPVVG